MNPLTPFLEQSGFVMLDGGLSTQLERHGARLSGELWTSRVLLDAPGLLAQAHSAFLRGGADVIASASYQATTDGFVRAGIPRPRAAGLLQEAVDVAIHARDEFWASNEEAGRLRPLVAASLGPYGASLHDGSEYHGNYDAGHAELTAFHRERVALLENSGADLFAFETIPSLLEARAILEVLEAFPELSAWISFTGLDERRIVHGEPFAECVAEMARPNQVLAVGVNCTAPTNIPPLLSSVAEAGTTLAVYPNSGEHWDAEAGVWAGQACNAMEAVEWHRLGARLIGGCCRTDANSIRRMRTELENALS